MNNELQDISDIDRLLPKSGFPEWLLYAAFLGFILAMVTYIVWQRQRATKTMKCESGAAYTLALATLEAWRSTSADIPIQRLASGISLVMRIYIESTTGDPSLYETREQLSVRNEALKALEDPTRTRILAFLTYLSSLEYTQQAKADQKNLLARACTLLEELRMTLGK